MFSINSDKTLPRLKDIYSWWQLDRNGKLVLAFLASQDRITPSISDSTAAEIQSPSDARGEPDFDPVNCPDDRFMDRGNDLLLEIGFKHVANRTGKAPAEVEKQSRTRRLPPHFVRSFCIDRVFIKDIGHIKVELALTALDYIRDLEFSRRDILREAAGKLGIDELNWRNVLGGNPEALKWVEQTQGNELRAETLYADLFLDLRIWTMTSILLSEDFSKQGALAMLNTLFPPAVQQLPSNKINPKILQQQRSIFYRYILDVAVNGPGIMKEFERKLNHRDNRHNWVAVRMTMEKYMDVAAKMIDQAKVAEDMLQPQRTETLEISELTTSRSFTGALFDMARPKTPKTKSSMTDMRVKFGLNKKPSGVFGQVNSVYSKSMVNVSRPEQERMNQSMVDVSSRNFGTGRSTPATSQKNFDTGRSTPATFQKNFGTGRSTPATFQKNFDTGRSTPATFQKNFDNLISLRDRNITKPMGFVPPPLDELEQIFGRSLTANPEDYDAESTATPNSSPRVSFDFDAALGLNNTYRRPSLSSDPNAPDQSNKPKPNLQIDTEAITSKQRTVSPPAKPARALPKYQKPAPFSAAARPQTADDPSTSRSILKSPASSNKLFSASGPPPFEPLPPLATLPVRRRQDPEPGMMPEPLNINRQRKPATPETSNLNSFPPRNNDKDRASSAQTPTTKTASSDIYPDRIDRATQDRNLSLEIKNIPSNVCATASHPSTSSETSSYLSKQPSASFSASSRLPSDNFDFLNRPYTGSSQDNKYATPVIMKKSSFTALFSRKKASSPTLRNDFQASNGLGISTEPNNPTSAIPQQPAEIKPSLKKKSSFAAAFMRSPDKSPEMISEAPALTTTPRSTKVTRFVGDENQTSDGGETDDKEGDAPKQKLKQKSSRNFSNPLRSSASRPNMRPEASDGSEQPERGLKKMASAIFGGQGLKTSDSQATLRPEPRVLKKKRSNFAVGETGKSSSLPPQLPPLRKQTSFAAGPASSTNFSSDRTEYGVGGPVRPPSSGMAGTGAYTRYPVEEDSVVSTSSSTSAYGSKSPTSPLANEFIIGPDTADDGLVGQNPPAPARAAPAPPLLKKKKSMWNFAKRELTEEELAEKARKKEEKRIRDEKDWEERGLAVASFVLG